MTRAPRAAIAALALAAGVTIASSPAHADCEVRGVASLERLRVRVPDQRIRTMAVTDLPIAVRPGRGNHYRDVRVLAPLSFAGRSDGVIPWIVAPGHQRQGDLVWLTPAADIEDVRESRARPELSIRVRVDRDVWLDRLHVPCRAVSVGHSEESEEAPEWVPSSGPRWAPRRATLWLAARSEGDVGTVQIEAPEGLSTPLIEISRRAGRVLVAARFSSGVQVRGWALARDLRAMDRARFGGPPRLRPTPTPPTTECRRGPAARGEYVGPARIAQGTLVHTDPEGLPWAAITEPAVLTVAWRTRASWARIVHVAGLRDDGECPEVLTNAWVPRAAVSLQGE